MPVTYEDDVHPYTDLALGPRGRRAARRRARRARRVAATPGCVNQPADLGVGHYVGTLAPANTPRCATASTICCEPRCRTAGSRPSSASGGCGTTTSRGCMRACWRPSPGRMRPDPETGPTSWAGPSAASDDREPALAATMRYLPALLRAAVITLVLSCVSMALAVATGIADRDRPRLRRPAAALRGSPRGSSWCAARRCCCSSSSSTSGSSRSCSCRRSPPRCSGWG